MCMIVSTQPGEAAVMEVLVNVSDDCARASSKLSRSPRTPVSVSSYTTSPIACGALETRELSPLRGP